MDAEGEDVLSLVPLDEALADRQQRRGAHRRLFREMIKGELEAGPLTWLRRRALVKFARRLDIDRFEAELLIRGVEYEGALIPSAARSWDSDQFDEDRHSLRAKASVIRLIIFALLIVLNAALLRLGGYLPF